MLWIEGLEQQRVLRRQEEATDRRAWTKEQVPQREEEAEKVYGSDLDGLDHVKHPLDVAEMKLKKG